MKFIYDFARKLCTFYLMYFRRVQIISALQRLIWTRYDVQLIILIIIATNYFFAILIKKALEKIMIIGYEIK